MMCKLKKRYEYRDKKTGKQKYFYKIKSPKLIEAYKHFFGYEPNPQAMHDAIIDAVICLRVFFISLPKNKRLDVCGTNPIITDYIMKISPPGYSCCLEEDQEIILPKMNMTRKQKPKLKRSKTRKHYK
jgi:hypothetical protein